MGMVIRATAVAGVLMVAGSVVWYAMAERAFRLAVPASGPGWQAERAARASLPVCGSTTADQSEGQAAIIGSLGIFILVVAGSVAFAGELIAIQDDRYAHRLWDRDICGVCGYDLAALPAERCPECGTPRPSRGASPDVEAASAA